MRGYFVCSEDADEPYGPVEGDRLGCWDGCCGRSIVTWGVGELRGEHGFEQLGAFEPVRHWTAHESMERDGWVGEVGEELEAFRVIVGYSDGNAKGSFTMEEGISTRK